MSQVDNNNKQHFSPLAIDGSQPFLSTGLIPKMTCHDASVSSFAWLFLTQDGKQWERLKRSPTATSFQKKEKKRTSVATNLSYCQCEHISTHVADKHAVTAIKKCLNICTVSSLKKKKKLISHGIPRACNVLIHTVYKIPLQRGLVWPQSL